MDQSAQVTFKQVFLMLIISEAFLVAILALAFWAIRKMLTDTVANLSTSLTDFKVVFNDHMRNESVEYTALYKELKDINETVKNTSLDIARNYATKVDLEVAADRNSKSHKELRETTITMREKIAKMEVRVSNVA